LADGALFAGAVGFFYFDRESRRTGQSPVEGRRQGLYLTLCREIADFD
jgi:hypothetical protein